MVYPRGVPRLWNDTIEAHRREVRDTVMQTTATLVAERGLRSVTMSAIAEQSRIGRATLYKYFSDVEAILLAWHERQVADHLDQLIRARERADGPAERLEAVLRAYALTAHERHGHFDADLTTFLHRDESVVAARHQLHALVGGLLSDAATAGHVRDDVTPGELVHYCLHALAAANTLPSKAAVRRLVAVTLTGLRPALGDTSTDPAPARRVVAEAGGG